MTTELISQKLTLAEIFVPKGLDPIIAKVKEKVKEFKAEKLDMEKKKDRDKVRSFASDVAKSKTFVDKARILYVKDKKAALKIIDSEGKKFRDTLDEIKIDVRTPLTEWEEEETKKKELERLQVEKDMDHEEALSMHDLFEREKAMELKEAEMEKKEEERLAKEKAEQEEKDRIENEARIKKEAAEQATKDAEDKIKLEREAKEEAERQKLQAEENAKQASIKAEEDAKQTAIWAENDRIQAEEKAKADQEAAVQKAKDDADRKTKRDAELEKIRQDGIKEEADRKAANKRHQASVNNKIKDALIVCAGLDEETAKKVIIETASGNIPFLKIQY